MIMENARLRVEIAELGAELMSVYDKKNETELLFNGDPAYWKRRSPVLFPNVGKTFNNTVKINGKSYPTAQHGFARDSIFALEEADDVHAVYLLASNGNFSEKYPFEFELRIAYVLEEASLKVLWSVKNINDEGMAFTIGGHPAFCFTDPFDKKEDYLLEFPGRDALEFILLDPAAGAADPTKKHTLLLENHRLSLSEELFANDAMIFDNAQISEVWLCAKDGKRRVGMICEGFPNYGIWSVKNAPFVCLEPWMGRADDIGFDKELADKPNVNTIDAGEIFTKEYSVVLP